MCPMNRPGTRSTSATSRKGQTSGRSRLMGDSRRAGDGMAGKSSKYTERTKLMAVSVTIQPAFSPGSPAPLFEKRLLPQTGYDVLADGKRFVILDRPTGEPPLSIHVVHNWFEEFRGQQREQTK